jgi:hypothetical protein
VHAGAAPLPESRSSAYQHQNHPTTRTAHHSASVSTIITTWSTEVC